METKMTREEAIEIVKKHGISADGTKFESALRELIPELAESEDERIRKELINQIEKSRHHPADKARWIAYLEKQKEQKPAEWSEEDEKKIIFLERLIEHNVPDGQYGWVDGMKGGFVTKSEAISMLKSLRPSWKPSEVCYGPKGDPDPAGVWKPSKEQMKALNDTINILAESPFLHQNDYLFNILNGLREELKKLL